MLGILFFKVPEEFDADGTDVVAEGIPIHLMNLVDNTPTSKDDGVDGVVDVLNLEGFGIELF